MSEFARSQGVPNVERIWQEWRVFCEKPPIGFEKYFKEKEKQASAEGKITKEAVKEAPTAAQQSQSKSFPKSTPPPKPTSQQWSFGMFGGTR